MNNPQAELIIKMYFSAWEAQNKQFADLLDKLPEEALMLETAPGRNTGIYLLGHIVAVTDNMLKLMGFRDKMYPELFELFIKSPDKSGKEFPTAADLKARYQKVTTEVNNNCKTLSTEDWLSRHTAVSEEDFAKEPHRNKLNILVSRTTHLAGHTGQMVYLFK
jgi:uncharacterized damage-inducible protein DinB